MLRPYRVLDLTTERGLLCGQILGDLGADVVAIEPPGGSPARQLGPFAADRGTPDSSLVWWAFARNKRSLTLDVTRSAGRALLLRLAATADFLIESFDPGYLAQHGLGSDDLGRINPALVYVSITPFGQHGPKAAYADSDLVILAAGGPLVLTGDDDRAPVRLCVPQAYLHASADAAVAALIAHHERMRSGRGQHVDIAAQQSVALATQSYILAAALDAPEVRRTAGGLKSWHLTMRLLYPARDGWVAITFLFGSAIGPFSRRLIEWIYAEGGDKDWIAYTQLLLDGREPVAEFERVKQTIEAFTRTKTTAELLRASIERSLLIAPVATIADVLASPQLAARDYWQSIERPDGQGPMQVPGPFARFSAAPLGPPRRPPRVGEHTTAILDELGLDAAAQAALRHEGVV
jgi:crotonobetainyl-CoA:carnitine CoA-transferase CaiB-like acyl-CoA transferase